MKKILVIIFGLLIYNLDLPPIAYLLAGVLIYAPSWLQGKFANKKNNHESKESKET